MRAQHTGTRETDAVTNRLVFFLDIRQAGETAGSREMTGSGAMALGTVGSQKRVNRVSSVDQDGLSHLIYTDLCCFVCVRFRLHVHVLRKYIVFDRIYCSALVLHRLSAQG